MMTTRKAFLIPALLLQVNHPAVFAFTSVVVVQPRLLSPHHVLTRHQAAASSSAASSSSPAGKFDSSLFDLFEGEEEEMFPIAENYVHARYQQYAKSREQDVCGKEDVAVLLKSLLPPVTPDELDVEVEKILGKIMENPENSNDRINEDCFVRAIVQNSYWRNAGSLVVKELMFFDALYYYYQNGESLLENDDYETLKENLTWEGSSVATMNRNECLFVNAVAASKRGGAILSDGEYKDLKSELKNQKSWVVSRGKDALEKLGLDTF